MTDYTVPSGAGQLMIRDTGTLVEFWVRSGYSIDYDFLYFNYTANGVTSGDIRYPLHDTNWHRVAYITLNGSQTVTFRLLTDTNTTSLGGPTTISHYISRASVPPAPDPVTFSSITATSFVASFTNNGNGGASATWQLGWNTVATAPAHVLSSDGSTLCQGFKGATLYYFWARGVNSEGYGPWSSVRSVRTLPAAPASPTAALITQKTFSILWGGEGNNGNQVTTRQLGWGTSPSTPTTVATTQRLDVVGLNPATNYYIFARSADATGYGAWTAGKLVRTSAGARIYTNGAWHDAIPYVKQGGIWKIAEPWRRTEGVWKKLG